MKVLLIDDMRLPSYISSTYGIDVTKVAKNYSEGIHCLIEERWDILCLDHDLGNATAKTGYDIVCFLEENPDYLPKEIVIVSANPVGRANIQRVIDKLYK